MSLHPVRIKLYTMTTATLMVAGLVATTVIPGTRGAIAAEAKLATEVSTWEGLLPPADLERIVQIYVEDMKRGMRSPGLFARGRKKVAWQARVIAVLGNIGVMTMKGENAQKAAALRAAGIELSEAAEDRNFKAAKKAYDAIGDYPAKIKPVDSTEVMDWNDVIDSETLMKSVSSIDSNAGKANKMSDRDFKKESMQFASLSQLMACLAVISREHEEGEDWKKWCDEMREGSIVMAKAYAKGDLEAAKEAHNTLQKSCNDCHQVYRSE
ncbi:hypothetical protein Pan216_50860 [Planctomycetes bacterium Pan216]|uniref:Cytochrome C n=1 Tax=Kolteria novifilia TaxID=2527975 RepID=A0A518BB87_9BACT|nr:hypothetical protein Pan216_50860 [Planctomycetes bacterium Pan216]